MERWDEQRAERHSNGQESITGATKKPRKKKTTATREWRERVNDNNKGNDRHGCCCLSASPSLSHERSSSHSVRLRAQGTTEPTRTNLTSLSPLGGRNRRAPPPHTHRPPAGPNVRLAFICKEQERREERAAPNIRLALPVCCVVLFVNYLPTSVWFFLACQSASHFPEKPTLRAGPFLKAR